MKNTITKFLKYGTLISTYALIASVVLQIFARFFLANAPSWTEEASRLFFIYAIAFSAGLAIESGEYIQLDWLYDKLSKNTQKILRIVIASATLLLFVVIAYYATQFVLLGQQETSPGMKIKMSYSFFSMVILAASMTYFTGLNLRQELKNWKS